MALITEARLRNAADEYQRGNTYRLSKSAEALLREATSTSEAPPVFLDTD